MAFSALIKEHNNTYILVVLNGQILLFDACIYRFGQKEVFQKRHGEKHDRIFLMAAPEVPP